MSDTLTGEPLKVLTEYTGKRHGFDQAPGAGERFHVLDDISEVREIASSRAHASSQENLSGVTTKVSFENQEMLQEVVWASRKKKSVESDHQSRCEGIARSNR